MWRKSPDSNFFVIECFELLLKMNIRKEYHVYRKGLLDGVKILKWLEVFT